MTIEQAREISNGRPWWTREHTTNLIGEIDRAARRETLEWVIAQAHDGWVIAGVVKHRLEELKHV
jgi:hypothetical protein